MGFEKCRFFRKLNKEMKNVMNNHMGINIIGAVEKEIA
jgi:hypothetical protein